MAKNHPAARAMALSECDVGQNVLEDRSATGLTTHNRSVALRAQRLTAIEVDAKRADSLGSRLRGNNVEVVTGDATGKPFSDAHFREAFPSSCCIICLPPNYRT